MMGGPVRPIRLAGPRISSQRYLVAAVSHRAAWDVEHPRAASVAATIDGAYSRMAATGLRHQVKSFSMGRAGRPASSWLSVCA